MPSFSPHCSKKLLSKNSEAGVDVEAMVVVSIDMGLAIALASSLDGERFASSVMGNLS